MPVKFVKTTARTAVAATAAAVAALGVAFAPAALASPAPVSVQVPCSATALAADISGATSGETLNLRVPCIYVLHAALPDVSTNLTIQGGGFATLERSFAPGTPDFSILVVDPGVDLVVNNVNFRNGGVGGEDGATAKKGITPSDGTGDGGAIDNHGILTVTGGVFRGSQAVDGGGAIYNDHKLTVINAAFIGNTADSGGGIRNGVSSGNGPVATLTDDTFADNTASAEGGGFYGDGNATVTGSTFRHNQSGVGGGVFNDGGMRLAGDTFLGNQASAGCGGGFTNEDAAAVVGDIFTGNTASDCGGGMYNEFHAAVAGTTFTGNAAEFGGGLYNDDIARLFADTFRHNLAEEGGGIYNDGILTVRSSKVLSNTASTSGGIFNDHETVILIQSAVAGNEPDNCEPLNSIAGCAD